MRCWRLISRNVADSVSDRDSTVSSRQTKHLDNDCTCCAGGCCFISTGASIVSLLYALMRPICRCATARSVGPYRCVCVCVCVLGGGAMRSSAMGPYYLRLNCASESVDGLVRRNGGLAGMQLYDERLPSTGRPVRRHQLRRGDGRAPNRRTSPRRDALSDCRILKGFGSFSVDSSSSPTPLRLSTTAYRTVYRATDVSLLSE